MNCTALLATTQSHHLLYQDISQTQQPYFELSKDLNTIHAYGTQSLPRDILINATWITDPVYAPHIEVYVKHDPTAKPKAEGTQQMACHSIELSL